MKKIKALIAFLMAMVCMMSFSMAEETEVADSPTRPSPLPPIVPIDTGSKEVETIDGEQYIVLEDKGIIARDKDGNLMDTSECILINYGDDSLRTLVPVEDIIITEYEKAEEIEDKKKLTVFEIAYQELRTAETYDELADVSLRLSEMGSDLKAEDLRAQYFFNLDMTPEYLDQLKVSAGGYLLLEHNMDIKKDEPVIVMIYTLLTPDKQLPFSVGAESDMYGEYTDEVIEQYNLDYDWYMIPQNELTMDKDGQIFIHYQVMGPVAVLTKLPNKQVNNAL